MKRLALFLVVGLLPNIGYAEGFAQMDLTKISVDESAFFGGKTELGVDPDRLTLLCDGCASLTTVDLQFSTSTDGTEGRFRSGETTVEKLRGLCQAREPACTLDRVEIGPAIGWITTYPRADEAGSTVVLFRDGDVLSVRSLAKTMQEAKANAEIVLDKIAPQIVGK